jgi:hypothetical protein
MRANHVTITGADDAQKKELLKDILYIEGIFFSNSFPVLTKPANDKPSKDESLQVQSESTSNFSPSKDESKENAKPSVEDSCPASNGDDSNEDDDDEKINKQYPDAQKILLRNVGDSITAKYVGSGNRYVPKAQKRAFVVYLENQSGEIEFLQGTQLSEALMEADPKNGDAIKIKKVGQFKRAKSKEHAKPATFSITLV